MEKKTLTTGAADTLEPQAAVSDTPSVKKEKPGGGTAGFFCYIGPSIPGLIQHGDIYRGTRRAALAAAAAAIERKPLVKTLIVSGDRLSDARLKVKKPGNALHNNYQRVAGKA